MDKQKVVHIVSLLIAIAGVILANGEQWFSIPGIPPWLAHSWPTVFFFATMVDRIGVMVLNYFSTNTATKVASLLLLLVLPFFFIGCVTDANGNKVYAGPSLSLNFGFNGASVGVGIVGNPSQPKITATNTAITVSNGKTVIPLSH